MYIANLVRCIQQNLSTEYGIPVTAELFNRESADTYIRVFEKQSDLLVGFVACLSWRKLSISFCPRYIVTNTNAYKKWMETLEVNRGAFDLFCSKLRSESMNLSFHINQETRSDVQIVDDCCFFSVDALSGFLAVRDNVDFHEETILPIFLNFWGLVLSFTGIYEEADSPLEGKVYSALTKKYERNGIYRKLCIEHYGCTCQICGENLEKKYGSVAVGLIEVHHIEPLSEYDRPKVIDPIKDLLPVCPNCHAVLHKRKPAFFPSEVRKMLKEEKNG